jgi:predicted nuclease with TOPRIM domain
MLEDIKSNIEKLIALYEGEKAERRRLASELEQCRVQNESCLKQIAELEQQVDNLHLTEAFRATTGNDSGAKDKIDKLIREIDKCISLLEK